MTIFYDSSDHLALITATSGTVWGTALFPCLVVVAIYAILWALMKYTDLSSPALYSDDQQDVLSLLVAFLIVANNDMMAQRYDQNRNLLMRFHHLVRETATRALIHANGAEAQDKLDEGNRQWKKRFKSYLKNFVRDAMDVLRDPSRCLELTHDLSKKSGMRLSLHGSSNYDARSPYNSLKKLSTIIAEQDKFLTTPIVIQVEMVFFNNINLMNGVLDELYMTVTTPLPFPLTHIVKIVMFIWAALVPFFIDDSFSFMNIFVVFFLIYAVVGLDAVACEISDPFGDDKNDLEVEKITRATLQHIDRILGGEFNPFSELQDIELESKTVPTQEDLSSHSIDGTQFIADPQLLRHEEIGWNELKRQKYSAALHEFLEALSLCQNNLESASFHEIIGDIYVIKNLHDDAIEHYQNSLENIKQSTDVKNIVGSEFLQRVGKKLSDTFLETAQYRSAFQSYTKLLQWYPSTEDSHDICDIQHRIGMLYYLKDDFEKSFNHLWLSLRRKRKLTSFDEGPYWEVYGDDSRSSNIFVATLLYCLGIVHEERKEYNWALSRFTESLAIQRRYSDLADFTEMTISTLSHTGYAHKKLGNSEEANANMITAQKLAEMAKLAKPDKPNIEKQISPKNGLSLTVDGIVKKHRKEMVWEVSRKIIMTKRAPGRLYS